MQLTSNLVRAYASFVGGDSSADVDRLVDRLHGRSDGWRDIFVVPDADGVSASMRFEEVRPGHWITLAKRRPGLDDGRRSGLRRLVAEVTAELKRRGAVDARTRVADDVHAGFDAALRDAGWTYDHARVEFDTPVGELPHEVDSPVHWCSLADVGENRVVEVLRRCAIGDAGADDVRADPRGSLRAWRSDPVLTNEPDAIRIGRLRERDVAFCMAQVNRHSGWSRITYLGLVPDVRGQRLSRWVHRHGFTLIRELGGCRYVGGTDERNGAMLHLFRTHGCVEQGRVHAWRWSADEAHLT